MKTKCLPGASSMEAGSVALNSLLVNFIDQTSNYLTWCMLLERLKLAFEQSKETISKQSGSRDTVQNIVVFAFTAAKNQGTKLSIERF